MAAATVSFNSPEEFLDEIAKSKGKVYGNIVRTTRSYREEVPGMLHRVRAVATALVDDKVILRLTVNAGQKLIREPSPVADERATAILTELEGKLSGMGYEIRAGVYE